eukprot:Rhum_TRINITY_DN12268_c0_g1::Rhum_TRINITY_DN12268_c0_g1_i1::g.50621::m.50621/K11450/KDM1A, AOF2, LSD1; lysine-specific histone demethylase 1A
MSAEEAAMVDEDDFANVEAEFAGLEDVSFLTADVEEPAEPVDCPVVDVDDNDDEDDVVLRTRHKLKKSKKEKKDKKEKKQKKEKRRRAATSDDEDDDDEESVAIESDPEPLTPPVRRAAKKSVTVKGKADDVVVVPEAGRVKKEVVERATYKARELVFAALRNGMPGKYKSIAEQEIYMHIRSDADTKRLLYTRNLLIKLWENNPLKRLYLSDLKARADNANLIAAPTVFSFLEEHGVINVGAVREQFPAPKNGRTACVVGAGISGLLAAQQLAHAGFAVTVFEASGHVGGRCLAEEVTVKGKTFRAPLGPANRYHLAELHTEREDAAADNAADDTMSVVSSQAGLPQLVSVYEPLDHLDPEKKRQEGDDSASMAGSMDTAAQDAAAREMDRAPVDLPHAALHCILKQAGIQEEWWMAPDTGARTEQSEARFFTFNQDGQVIDIDDEYFSALEAVDTDLDAYARSSVHEGDTLAPLASYVAGKGSLYLANIDEMECNAHACAENMGRAERERQQTMRRTGANICGLDRLPVGVSWHGACERLAEGLDIRLSHPVTAVEHASAGVRIQSAGTWHSFHHCVVTVPIGVLKDDDAVTFTPPLPDDKQTAIRRIGSGLRNTLVLAFDKPFWAGAPFMEGAAETELDCVLHSAPGGEGRGVGAQCKFEAEPVPHIILSLSGPAAALVEEGCVDDLTVQALRAVRALCTGVEVPDPVAVHCSAWRGNEHARGSAPFATPETTQDDFHAMATPLVESPLYFAGDATHPELYGTLLGAVASAVRVAQDVFDRHRAQIASGLAKRPVLNPRDRILELKMNGTAHRLTEQEQHTGADVKKKVNANDPSQQHSRGSSRNLAAKYAKEDEVPIMQRNLFNAVAIRTGDQPDGKRQYVNREAARRRQMNVAGLARLERATEMRWREAKSQKKRELAHTLAAGTHSAPEPKRPRRTEAPDAVHYNNENAVDDLLPTWYYQQSNIPAKRNREFAQQFFRGAQEQRSDAEREEARQYRKHLEDIIADVLLGHASVEVAKERGTQVTIFSQEFFREAVKKLSRDILARFKAGYEKRTGAKFLHDWAQLPDVTAPGVQVALRGSCSKLALSLNDPSKEQAIKQLGFDPNTRVAQERARDEAQRMAAAATVTNVDAEFD